MTNYNLPTSARKAILLAAIGALLITLLTIAMTMHEPTAHAIEAHPTQSYTVSSDAATVTPTIDPVTIQQVSLPFCAEEDSHNCLWDAQAEGNGKGDSFIDWNGSVYYIDHAYDYCTDEVPSPCTPDSNN